jgi:predicted permease
VSIFVLYGANWLASMFLPKFLYYSTVGVLGATAIGIMVVHLVVRLPERERKPKRKSKRVVPLLAFVVFIPAICVAIYAFVALREIGFISPGSAALLVMVVCAPASFVASLRIPKSAEDLRTIIIAMMLLASLLLPVGLAASITNDIAVMKGINFYQRNGAKNK